MSREAKGSTKRGLGGPRIPRESAEGAGKSGRGGEASEEQGKTQDAAEESREVQGCRGRVRKARERAEVYVTTHQSCDGRQNTS